MDKHLEKFGFGLSDTRSRLALAEIFEMQLRCSLMTELLRQAITCSSWGGDCRFSVADGWMGGADYATPAINGPLRTPHVIGLSGVNFLDGRSQSLHKST